MKRRDFLGFLIPVSILYIVFYFLGIGCPIHFLTGISCAGCGMTRAWISALHLDFHQAFYYHPLFWTIPFITIFLYLYLHRKRNTVLYNIIGVSIILLFFIVYFVRLLNLNDTIVEFDIKNGAIWRCFQYIKTTLERGI